MNRSMKHFTKILVILVTFLSSEASFSVEKPRKAKTKAPKKEDVPAEAPVKVNGSAPIDDVVTGSSTHIDFSETSIDGKMKAPDGFFLQGHNANSLSQMVKLRSNFRSELRNSSSAVTSHVK